MTTPLPVTRPRLSRFRKVPVTDLFDENGVFYPDTDGRPMPDAEYQFPLFQSVVMTLRHYFRDQPRTRVNGNTFIYYEQGNPSRYISPDCYVALDVDVSIIERHNTYRIWSVGKPPDFVLEIASKSTARRDLVEKRALYARLGIGEYWRYDATPESRFYGEPLVGERLVGGLPALADRYGWYERLPLDSTPDGTVRSYSPTLGLDLCWEEGRLWFYDPVTGERLRDLDEAEAALQESEAALQESEAALQESEAALQESEAALQESEADRQREAAARQAAEADVTELREQLRRLQARQRGK